MRTDKLISDVLGEELAITPSDLYSRRIGRQLLGGYDRVEVDELLERTADVLEQLIQKVREQAEQTEEQRKRIEEYREMEATLRSALISSQKFGEDIVDNARREANALLEEARLKRAEAQLEYSQLPANLSRDIKFLEEQRQRLRQEILAILATHRNLLDSLVPEQAVQSPSSFFELDGQQPPNAPESGPGDTDVSASKTAGAEERDAEEHAAHGENRPAPGTEIPGMAQEEDGST